MPAVLFGSISTLADTSEIQRESFNQAFAHHDLGWEWSQEEYAGLLDSNGGAARIAAYAEKRGEEVDAALVHATKSEIFRKRLVAEGVPARPGVAEVVESAREAGWKVALVTTTANANVVALTAALKDEVDLGEFDLLVDNSMVDATKPDPAAYTFAVDKLGETPEGCVAIEDNVGGVESAIGAGVACAAYPNQNTADHDFSDATTQVDSLSFAALRDLASA